MRVAVTGGTGLVGHLIVRRLAAAGHDVVVLSRGAPTVPVGHLPYSLGDRPDLRGTEALVHAALDHAPGRYRGGEGADAAEFLSRNLGGTITLFRSARDAGVRRVVFLSTRAVYGDYPAGTHLIESLQPKPDTLYGHVKREAEAALAGLATPDFSGVCLRATGVYGPAPPGRPHKWAALFDAFAAGAEVAPRIGTEVHGDDLSAAVELVLTGEVPVLLNVSDFVLDRADLLAAFSRLTGVTGRLPARSDPGAVSAMSTDRLQALGWTRRGSRGLEPALREMCAAHGVAGT